MSEAVLTSSAYKQCFKQKPKQGHKHMHGRTDGLTKNYSPFSSLLTFVNARGGAGKDASKWGGK